MFFKLKDRIRHLFFDIDIDWEIGFTNGKLKDIFSEFDMSKVNWFKMPKEVFWADPFGIYLNEKYYIFYEEYKKEQKYGVINCLILNKQLKIISNQTIIDEKLHFSFPFVFEKDGKFFMIPETHQKNRLSIYECIDFPNNWTEKSILINEACVDSLVFFDDGVWNLLYSKIGQENKLFIKRNHLLFDNWDNCDEELINENPYFSRNGGQIIKFNNTKYRIAQNCQYIYGESIVITEINSLRSSSFSENIINEIKPNKSKEFCIHTLNFCHNIWLIDRRRERLFLKSPKRILNVINSKLKRTFAEN